MKDRIASLFLVFAMLVSLCPSALAQDHEIAIQSGGAEKFTDVPTSHWAYGYINQVVGSGLFNGKTPSSFEPSNAMTRAQFVLVMARMEGRNNLEGQTLNERPFPDVTTTRLAAGPIAWAAQANIVLGFSDGTFRPDAPISRGQFAALIHRYIVMKGYTNLNVVTPEPAQFADAASVNSNFTEDVEYARVHGLLTGYSDGTVKAANPITRAAIAAILARFLDLVGESIDPATGKYYIPLLDYPRSGEDPTPVDAPSSYDDIKLKVNNSTHGSAPAVRATRNGAVVAGDDLQPGDRVTVTCNPDSGYTVSVRARDAKGKTVTVNKATDQDNTFWFTAPKALPVTVTVTYNKIPSGGGGGGGGGGGSNGARTYYYLEVRATKAGDGTGQIWLSKEEPTADNINSLQHATALNWDQEDDHDESFEFWAVLNPSTGVCTVSQGATMGQETTISGFKVAPITVTSSYTTPEEADAANAIVQVTGTFTGGGNEQPPAEDNRKDVKLTAVLGEINGATYKKTGDMPADAPVTQSVDLLKANKDDTVTVSATQKIDFGGYKVIGIDMNGAFNKIDTSEDTAQYQFKMPDADANVTVVYEELKDNDLEYNFTVSGLSNGNRVTLNVGGQPLEFTADGTQTASMSHAAYMTKYPDKGVKYGTADSQWTLPVTLSARPADNYKFNSATLDSNVFEIGASVDVTPTDTHTVAVVFDKTTTFGYNLTIIGQGTVELKSTQKQTTKDKDGNEKEQPVLSGTHTNAELVDTYSKSVLSTKDELTLEMTVKPSGSLVCENGDIQLSGNVSGVPNASGTTTLTLTGVGDITVDFHKKDRVQVTFSVTNETGNGEIEVKLENGQSLSGTTTLKNQDQTESYTVWEDALVTLTPKPGSDYKTKSITVDGKSNDILDKDGYSFQATKGKANAATVSFGSAGKASFLAQGSFNNGVSNESAFAHSSVDPLNMSTTMADFLKSLNDSGNIGGDTLTNLEKAFIYYLATDNGKGQPGKNKLEEMLNDAIQSQLKSQLPKEVKSQTDAMLASGSSAEQTLTKGVRDALNGVSVSNQPLNDAERKASIIQQFKSQNSAVENLSDDAFDVTLQVVPVRDELVNYFQPLLMAYMSEKLGNVNLGDVSAAAEVVVTGYDKNGNKIDDPDLDLSKAEITISASAKFTSTPQPTLDFAQFLAARTATNPIPVQVTVTPVVTANGQSYPQTSMSETISIDDVGASVAASVRSDITSKLTNSADGVDAKVSAEWNNKLNEMLPGGEYKVNMGQILSDDPTLLNTVVTDTLNGPDVDKQLKKVASLGDAANTKGELSSVFSKLVKQEGEGANLKLSLLGQSVNKPIGAINDDGALVVTLDFDDVFAGDNAPYENMVDMALSLRKAVETDINAASADGQTAQSVLAGLIAARIRNGSGTLSGTKWGGAIDRSNSATVKELAKLIADLAFTPDNTPISQIWAKFEAKGYESVQVSFGVRFAALTNAARNGANEPLDSIGFKLEQEVN